MSPATGMAADIEQLRMIVERLPSGVVAVDKRMNVVAANPAAHRMVGHGKLQVGKPLPPLWFDQRLQEFLQSLFERDVEPQRHEIRPGDDYVFSMTGVPPRHGKTALLVIEDISGHERSATAEREFIANAAHELLTPLTGIVGAAHALESGAKLEPELRDRFITHITGECNRMARIARGLLVLARAQSGAEPPLPGMVQLAPLLAEAAEGAGAVGDVTIDCAPELTAFVDRDLIEQAFTNLIGNARRHSGDGPVTVTAYDTGGTQVSVDIADEGRGFPQEAASSLGRRFSSHDGRHSRGVGFGLGLSIATQSINACGGTLTIEPRSGQGTIARVELPRGRDGGA